ncbi:hypothetical protein BDR07DRAFT_1399975 [Suillus spraguei]|nr:hypothetical protein BDR07DRAFT_1399975 [Suillus spraguei]
MGRGHYSVRKSWLQSTHLIQSPSIAPTPTRMCGHYRNSLSGSNKDLRCWKCGFRCPT